MDTKPPPPSQISTLSQRARALATPSPSASPIWTIVADQWHPTSNPNGYVSVGVAENTLMHPELSEYIHRPQIADTLPHSAFTYGDGTVGSKRLRAAAARFLNRKLTPPPVTKLEMEHVVVTNGLSHAIEHTSWAFCDPGDGFLLGQPHYGAFIQDIGLRPGVEVLRVSFGPVDPMGVAAVENYEKAILSAQQRGVQPKALMLCSPHNPLGRCYSRDALLAYMRLCQKYHLHLVADEIYAFSTWVNPHSDPSTPSVPFTSVLSIAPDGIIDPTRVHVLWGTSKDFGANGLRIGFIISQHNEAFRKALVDVCLYSYPSSVSEHIAANILEDDAWTDRYIATNRSRLAESYAFVVEFLDRHNIPHTPGSHAAFFLWVDLGKAYLDRHPRRRERQEGDDSLTQEITKVLLQNKVFLASGLNFGAETPGLFRIVFSHPRSFLEEALKRVVEAIGENNAADSVAKRTGHLSLEERP